MKKEDGKYCVDLNLDDSMTNATLLLVALLICHYLADFCLTMPVMIRAKVDGRNLWPIAFHATIHAVLIGLCLLVFAGCQYQPHRKSQIRGTPKSTSKKFIS